MAVFVAITANLSSHSNAFKSCAHSFNNFPSVKQSNCTYPVRRKGLNSMMRTRAIRDDSSSSWFYPTMTLYDVLCVPQSAELSEVKKAYREKVRIYHPDVCPPDEREISCKMFILVQEAYETLSDQMLRADYDLSLLFDPQLLFSQKRNVKQQKWADQIENLRVKSRSSERNSWGAKQRRSTEEMAAR
ncbi:hypothetical protein SUGI_0023430 [Cryptomeria japonica]|uniref:chaperone protein dnaJ 20, chloroplastic-like n=1 Tax=Cryptomeria japonica TaxID=3369 RepID=UPI00240893B8|nr:chaperone protein dnaJ 20, chloroplastic-like [Cryptomeria japonica]GLJ05702.1 hypothetical protein SUGI_0023430 [Cryptomeria japonica]